MSTHTTSVNSRPAAQVRRWVLLCALAEAIGMTAAATAAKLTSRWFGTAPTGREAFAALGLVVAGGLVEGVALGVAQSAGLSTVWPELRRPRFVLATLLVAGLGWAGASAPSVLGGSGSGQPPLLLVTLGGAALGVVMGAALGAVQALPLRGHARHPWRWVAANAVAWAPAMGLIFLGASVPSTSWSLPAVVVCGTVTGALAGAALGLVLGWWLPSLEGAPVVNRVLLGVLRSRGHRVVDRSLVGLRVRGRRTGRSYELPVMYALLDATETGGHPGLAVLPGKPAAKTWWRNLREPAAVQVLADGHWQRAQAVLLTSGEGGYDAARAAYGRRWPRVRVAATTPLVRVLLDG